MKGMIKNIIIIAAVMTSLFSCSHFPFDELHDTNHPNGAVVTLKADWSGYDGVIPEVLNTEIANNLFTFSSTSEAVFNQILPEARYTIPVYNTADNISVTGTTANAVNPTGVGMFFTSVKDVLLEKDKNYNLIFPMAQKVRTLTLEIRFKGNLADNVASISATLSGVASALNFSTDEHAGAFNVELPFVEGEEDTWSVTLNLLGMTGNQQILSGNIVFDNNIVSDVPLNSDLSEYLKDFNTDKDTPLVLSSEIEVLDEDAIDVGFVFEIDEWVLGGSGNGKAQ
ncbi:MAG: hypothetical protein LBM07_08230 [Culturomica sp.]|jgi:hypothetical protein|nr:hypothetical protein [Culturomica sp.]